MTAPRSHAVDAVPRSESNPAVYPAAVDARDARRSAFPGARQQQTQQTRRFAGRYDRGATSVRTRPPTPKQRKKYHRRRRANEREADKHSPPGSKAGPRRIDEVENRMRIVEIRLIAEEEEVPKGRLGAYFDKVGELQSEIEGSPKFRALLEEGEVSVKEIRAAARDAAKKAAEATDTLHPPLPSWWQDRMTYDWGDALVDDLMGNSADLTSSASPFPDYMDGKYGMPRRKVERVLRARGEEERFLLEARGGEPSAAVSPISSEDGPHGRRGEGTGSFTATK